jgi:hypothetical protein
MMTFSTQLGAVTFARSKVAAHYIVTIGYILLNGRTPQWIVNWRAS